MVKTKANIKNGNNSNNDYIDLMQLLRALWRKAWAIVLAAVIGGAAAFSYAVFLVTPLYKADAQMYVNNSSISVGSTSFSLSDLDAAQSLVDTYIVILNSRDTLNEIIDATGVDYNYQTLKSMLSAAPVNSTEVFSITVTSDDPEEAEMLANAIVEILPNRIADIVDGSSVRVVDYAVIPSGKASPNITKMTAIGMIVGVAIACAIIIVLTLIDTLIHNEDYLIETYDLPVLAVIPDLSDNNRNNDYYYAEEYGRREKAEVKK